MSGFFSYIFSSWYVAAAMLALLALTIFFWIKALKSGRKRSEERDRIIAELEKEKALRAQFKNLDESMITSDEIDDERLLFGVAMSIQMSIEKKEDLTAAFEALNEEKKNIYALNFVFEDSKYEHLSAFFRSNGEPLLSYASRAVKALLSDDFSTLFEKMYSMMDENREDISFDENQLEALDGEFKSLLQSKKDEILKTIANYIKASKTALLQTIQ